LNSSTQWGFLAALMGASLLKLPMYTYTGHGTAWHDTAQHTPT
jgi:hypothetical protein